MRTGTIYEQLWIIGGIIFGTDGQVVLLMAMVMLFYHSNFADSKNDVADLKNGTINRVQFVQESEVINMLSKAGAFNEENKVANADSRYGYVKQEGIGGGKLDFSDTVPKVCPVK